MDRSTLISSLFPIVLRLLRTINGKLNLADIIECYTNNVISYYKRANGVIGEICWSSLRALQSVMWSDGEGRALGGKMVASNLNATHLYATQTCN